MIELRDVALAYGDRTLFEGIDLALRRTEIVLLKGRSGDGKTSLLRILSRFARPTRGHLYLDGQPYDAYRYEALRARIVYLHQTPVLEATLSVQQNLLAPFSYGVHRDRPRPGQEELHRTCAALHLDPAILARQAGDLSVGEKQRVAVIRACLLEPDFMLLDEPLANLDAESAAAIHRWLGGPALARTGLVIASHQPVAGLPGRRVRILEIKDRRLHEHRD